MPFRTLYNQTLKTYPAAEIVLSAAILILSAVLNFFIYTQRWKIQAFTSATVEKSNTIEDNSGLNLDMTAKSEETGQMGNYTYL